MFNLANYKTVASRIDEFWEKYPNGSIETEMVFNDVINYGNDVDQENVTRVVFKATVKVPIYDIPEPEKFGSSSLRILATGYAEENDNDSKIDKFYENCETSAIGRALANANFGVKNSDGELVRPSREEMESVLEHKTENKKKSLFKKSI